MLCWGAGSERENRTSWGNLRSYTINPLKISLLFIRIYGLKSVVIGMADTSNKINKYSVEAAEILANEALHLPITEAVPIYEQLLAVYPTTAKFWKQYVEAQMAVNNDDATKQIFSRC